MKKLQYFFVFTVLFVCVRCNHTTIQTEKREDCISYFSFDSIEHYYVEVDSNGISFIERKNELSETEKKQLNMMYEDTCSSLSDTIMYQNLEQINFIKSHVPTNKFDTINKIFCTQKLDTCSDTNCIPAYRDVLIFKSKNKIVGIAKLCFYCKKSLIIGASDKTTSLCFKEWYDYIDNYSRLKEILYSK